MSQNQGGMQVNPQSIARIQSGMNIGGSNIAGKSGFELGVALDSQSLDATIEGSSLIKMLLACIGVNGLSGASQAGVGVNLSQLGLMKYLETGEGHPGICNLQKLGLFNQSFGLSR